MRLLVFIIVFFVGYNSSAQNPVNTEADGSIFWGNALPRDAKIPYKEIKGSPYHNDNLVMGKVYFKDDTIRRYLRYNSYTDEMEYVEKDRILALTNSNEIKSIRLNDQTYTFEPFVQNFKVVSGYFIELVNGPCRLLKRDIVVYSPKKPAKTSYHEPTPAKFVRQSADYFYSCPNPILEPFTGSGLQLKRLSAGDFDSVEDYIRDNKLRMRKEKDMIKLFKYLNGY